MSKIRPSDQPTILNQHEQTQTNIVKIHNKSTHVKVCPIQANPIQQSQLKNAQQVLECKICLETSLDSNQPFIQPCLCTGSLMHVHQACFQEWIKRLIMQKNTRQAERILQEGIQCEICKMKYQLKINYEKVCVSWKKLKSKIKYNKIEFILLVTLTILAIILLSVAASIAPSSLFDLQIKQLPTNERNTGSLLQQKWQKIFLITSLFVLVIVIIFSFYLLIKEFCFSYNTEFKYKGKRFKTMTLILQQ